MTEVANSLDVQSKNVPEPTESLVRHLDDLLERYLNLLHDYQTLQQHLSKNLSAVTRKPCL